MAGEETDQRGKRQGHRHIEAGEGRDEGFRRGTTIPCVTQLKWKNGKMEIMGIK